MVSKSVKDIVQTRDAVDGSWVYRQAPNAWRPYLKLARMDRPVGTWLLLWPCWWSVLLASNEGFGVHTLWLMVLFAVGATVMRGAGCTYNDIIDRNIDAQVARTQTRPIPAGEVSVRQAVAFMVFQCLAGLAVLLQFNAYAVMVGCASLGLVAVYPFMKRITYWPQAWLGLTFNWGALMGWAAVQGGIGWPALLLYTGGLCWTLGYDTIYAHQDKEDDALVGVKSTALALGEGTVRAIVLFYGLFIFALLGAGTLANLGEIYYIGIALAAIHLGVQVKRLDIGNPDICLSVFRSNISFGWIVFFSLIAGQLAS